MTDNRNILTAGRKALVDRLGDITQDNGYLTNAGFNVQTGWLSAVLQAEGVSFPLLVVQPAAGQPPRPGPAGSILVPGFNVVGAVSLGDEYDDGLDDLQLDIVRCLTVEKSRPCRWLPPGVINIQFGAPASFPPGEGLQAATVVVPIHLSIIVEGI